MVIFTNKITANEKYWEQIPYSLKKYFNFSYIKRPL